MKKLLLINAVAAICIGLSSAAMASPTLTLTGSSQSESPGAVIDDSEDEYSFLEDWIYWAFKDIFGWDRDGRMHYNPGNGGSDYDPGDGDGDGDWSYDPGDGDGGWDYDPGDGDGGWDYDPGDGGWDYDSGDGGWGCDTGYDGGWGGYPGNGDWGCGDTGTCPPQTIPAPGALLLGGIGTGIISWLRRRRTL